MESNADPAAVGVQDASPLRPFQRALLVVNPISGRGRGRHAAEELRSALEERGVPTEIFATQARGDAFTRLRCMEREVDLVVAVGGDGTLREVMDGLVDPGVPVALLPYGTANVLASCLGLPRDVHHTLEIIVQRRVQPVDVLRVNGKLSFVCVGVGIDAECVRAVEARRKGPITRWSYVAAVLSVLPRYKPPELWVEIDGKEHPEHFGFVLVANVKNYAGVLHLAEDAQLDDGLFEVYLFPTGSRMELFGAFVRGRLKGLPAGDVEMHRASSLRVRAEEPVPFQIDGDLGGEVGANGPLEIELAPNRYHLLVP